MSTSRQVADTIYNVGKNAIITKIDLISAYKLDLSDMRIFIYKVLIGRVALSF